MRSRAVSVDLPGAMLDSAKSAVLQSCAEDD